MKTYLLLLSCLLSMITLEAQRPSFGGGRSQGPSITGRITGVVIDSLTDTPVGYATVILFDEKNEQVNGGVTDEDGVFRLTEVKTGTYRMEVSFLGYATKVIPTVETTPAKPDLDMEVVHVLPAGVDLGEVTVTGEASLIENKVDRLVYNAEKDVSSSGGDASDVLRKVPLLSVDLDGNVSLRGSSNVQVLINGRPSTMFSSNLSEALKTIPADQIKSVEVITSPSARYDGEGTAGIINIITKKKNAEGITGSVSTSVGTRQNNAVVNLNAVRGRFGLNGNASSFWSWNRIGTIDFFREDRRADGTTNIFEQSGENGSQVLGFNGTVGAFYDFNAYNSINSSVRFNGFRSQRDGTLTGSNGLLGDPDPVVFERINDNTGLRSGFDWNTDYRKTFPDKSDQEFVFAFQLSGNRNDQENITFQDGNTEFYQSDILNTNDGLNLEYTLQADYIHPFSDGLKLEVGAKGVLRRIDSDYATQMRANDTAPFVLVPAASDDFRYDQDVLAGYVSMTARLTEKLSTIAGVRYERTEIGGRFVSNEIPPFANDYDNFLPSITFNYKLKQFDALKVSYARRIQRPSLFYVNPFTSVNDPNNISFGNPLLGPELTSQYEIGYNTFVKGISLNISSFYRRTTAVIESFVTINEELDRSETTYLNIGENESVGFNFFTSFTIKKFWTIRGGFNLFTYNARSSVDSIALSRDAVLWNGNLSSSFNLPKDWKIEMFGFFRSPRQTLQGTNPSFSLFSFGVRKEFNKRFSMGLRAVEPFSENKAFASELEGENFTQRSNFTIPFRSIGISLSYNFGQLDFKQRRRRGSSIDNDDLKGGGDNNNF